jgi:hypothetical protein
MRKSATQLPYTGRLLLMLLILACCAFWLQAPAVTPASDGGYAGFNTAEGTNALFNLTTGVWNTAVGAYSLFSDTTGSANTATGLNALRYNTSGIYNTALGDGALVYNNSSSNTAVGTFAMYYNTTGSSNTATGLQALVLNRTGSNNTAVGVNALDNNTAGSNNVAVGYSALFSSSGSNNTAIGDGAGHNITGNGNVCIGEGVAGVAGASNTTWIRSVYSSVASGRAVYVNSDNKLGTLASTQRIKDDIRPMGKASEAIFALEPVTFRYKKQIDPSRAQQFGLIAEQVATIDPDLITCDADGKPETVRYEAVNAMLLNEFLKEHRRVQELKWATTKQEAAIIQQQKDFQARIAEQEKEIQTLVTTVKEQASQIQKVSAQLELRNPEPQTVLNNQPVGAVHPPSPGFGVAGPNRPGD